MEHYVLKLYNVYINYDPELTLTHFTTMSNLAKLVFVLRVAKISGERLQGHWSSDFSQVKVAEWPPFRKQLLIRLTMCSLCFDYLLFQLFPVLVLRAGFGALKHFSKEVTQYYRL